MSQPARPRAVIVYADDNGKEPFTRWLKSLRDGPTRRRILQRITRLQGGNFGDFKPLGAGVSELRMAFGAGYRVYYGEDGETVVVLLSGGDKSTQAQDIEIAKRYWQEYLNRD